jgi:hypothetical protein
MAFRGEIVPDLTAGNVFQKHSDRNKELVDRRLNKLFERPVPGSPLLSSTPEKFLHP